MAAYFVGLILMATLAPFDFDWLAARSFPMLQFNLPDMAQNILLFLPLGVVFAQSRRINLMGAALLGAALSASVEFAQLSIIGRSSNGVDVLTNCTGAAVGWSYGARLSRGLTHPAHELILAFMLLPVCWVLALRAALQDNQDALITMAWLVLPALLVGLATLQRVVSHHRYQHLHLGAWAIMALVPMVYATRQDVIFEWAGLGATSGIICASLTALAIVFLPWQRLHQHTLFAILVALLAVITVIDATWFINNAATLQWTASSHLHWGDAFACGLCVFYAWRWMMGTERVTFHKMSA